MIRVFFLGPCFKAGTVSFYNLQQILHNFLLQPCRGRRQTKGSGGTAQTSVFKQFCCRRTRCCCCCFCLLLLLLLLGLISCFEGSSAFSLPFNRPQAHIRHLNSPCPISLPLSLLLSCSDQFCRFLLLPLTNWLLATKCPRSVGREKNPNKPKGQTLLPKTYVKCMPKIRESNGIRDREGERGMRWRERDRERGLERGA